MQEVTENYYDGTWRPVTNTSDAALDKLRSRGFVFGMASNQVWHYYADVEQWEYQPNGTTTGVIRRTDDRFWWTAGSLSGEAPHYAEAQDAIRKALRQQQPIDAITTEAIIGLIRQATQSMADVPGRTPQDKRVAYALMAVVGSSAMGAEGRMARERLAGFGADEIETEAVVVALEELALRLGAWLGRERKEG